MNRSKGLTAFVGHRKVYESDEVLQSVCVGSSCTCRVTVYDTSKMADVDVAKLWSSLHCFSPERGTRQQTEDSLFIELCPLRKKKKQHSRIPHSAKGGEFSQLKKRLFSEETDGPCDRRSFCTVLDKIVVLQSCGLSNECPDVETCATEFDDRLTSLPDDCRDKWTSVSFSFF